MIERVREATAIRRELKRRAGRRGLLCFGAAVFPEVEPNRPFEKTWFHRIIADELDRWDTVPDYPNLLIMMPPRHGKSELVSRFEPAYLFGKNPDKRIIATSYSQDLANAMSRDTQAIMLTDAYRDIFPKTRLARTRSRNETTHRTMADFGIIGGSGLYKGAGVGGGITGRGADRIIIDDPVKNREDAESETKREAVWRWYTSTLRTRLQKGGKIVLLLTRWHEDDLAGRILSQAQTEPHADRWKVVSFPALFERTEFTHPQDRRAEGEALWPAMYDLDYLLRTKATIGTYDWSALYQQQPRPAGGAIVQRAWLQIVSKAPADVYWVRAWDLAVSKKEKADFTASGQMGVDEFGNIYVRRFIRGRWTWPETRKQIRDVGHSEQVPVGVGGQGLQKGFVQDLQADRELADLAIFGYEEDKDKLTRALPWVARAEAGKFFVVQGAGMDDYIEELVGFTGTDDKHDDHVDWTSGAYRLLTEGPAETELVQIPDWWR